VIERLEITFVVANWGLLKKFSAISSGRKCLVEDRGSSHGGINRRLKATFGFSILEEDRVLQESKSVIIELFVIFSLTLLYLIIEIFFKSKISIPLFENWGEMYRKSEDEKFGNSLNNFCVLCHIYHFHIIRGLIVQFNFVSHLLFVCAFIVVWKLHTKCLIKAQGMNFTCFWEKPWTCVHQVFDTISIELFHIICTSIRISLTYKNRHCIETYWFVIWLIKLVPQVW
jgi:hypothetical protein